MLWQEGKSTFPALLRFPKEGALAKAKKIKSLDLNFFSVAKAECFAEYPELALLVKEALLPSDQLFYSAHAYSSYFSYSYSA